MSAAQAVIKNGELLLPHDVGCGAELIHPHDPRYAALSAHAVRDADLNGTPEENARWAARWTAKWELEDRRSA